MVEETGQFCPLTASVNVSILQEMQDAFAALTGASLSICNANGRLVTHPSCYQPACETATRTPDGQVACAHRIEAASRLGACPPPTPQAGIASCLCHAGQEQSTVPIEFDGQDLGTIIVGTQPATEAEPGNRHDESGDGRQDATLQAAQLLARAIGHLWRQDRAIRDRVEELTAVHDMAGMLSGTQDLGGILNTTARQVAEVMRVRACAIRLLDETTGELVIKAVHNLSDEYLYKGPVLLGENTIDSAAFAGETVYVPDVASDPRTRYPEQARKEGIVSGLCVPMTYRGQTVGVMRAYTGTPHRFSAFEVSLLRSIASQAAAAIVNARLAAQRSEARKHRRQLDYASEIQRRMIPQRAPQHKAVRLAGVYAPTLEVGGDFYDYLALPWGNLGLCVSDVVGKGVPAGLMMASVRSALRGHAHSIYDINEIMTQVNQHLCRDTVLSEFATLFYGVFSPNGRQLTYCNAGHEPPLLLRGERFTRLETGGMVIGIAPEAVFEKEVLDLEAGDVLVFCTDGVTEALNFEDEEFGRQRLRQSILRYRDEPVEIVAKQLLWDVRRFAGLAPQADDITLVVARIEPA